MLNTVSICIHESLSFTCIKLYKGNHIPSKLRHRNFSSRRYSSFRESILDLAHIVPSSLISWSFLVRVYDYLVTWNRVIRKSSSNPSKTNLLKVRLRSYEIANSGARESFIDDMDMMSRGNSRSFCNRLTSRLVDRGLINIHWNELSMNPTMINYVWMLCNGETLWCMKKKCIFCF